MSKKSKAKFSTGPSVDTSVPQINTGNAWLPVAPAGGETSTISGVNPALAAPDPTAPLVITPDMFQDGVTIASADGSTNPVATNLCATEAGAIAMQNWLKANGVTTTMVFGAPEVDNLIADEDKYSTLVPWLEDGKGARENAGLLLSEMQYWAQISRPVMLSQTVGAFTADDALEQTDPTNQGLAGNVPNEDSPTPQYPTGGNS